MDDLKEVIEAGSIGVRSENVWNGEGGKIYDEIINGNSTRASTGKRDDD